jgi:hypothetical protein
MEEKHCVNDENNFSFTQDSFVCGGCIVCVRDAVISGQGILCSSLALGGRNDKGSC